MSNNEQSNYVQITREEYDKILSSQNKFQQYISEQQQNKKIWNIINSIICITFMMFLIYEIVKR